MATSPGQEASLAPPMFEPEVFRKQMYCIEESISHCWDFSAPGVERNFRLPTMYACTE